MIRLAYLVFLMISVHAVAQDTMQAFHHRQLFLVKWNPLSLFDPESMMQLTGEYFLTSRAALQAEIGYGPPFLDKLSLVKQGALNNRQAGRFRAEYRRYRRFASSSGRYWALEGFAMTVHGTKTIYVDELNGVSNLLVPFPIHKRVVGGHLKVGVQRPVRQKRSSVIRSRFMYDFYAGIGLRYSNTFAESVNGYPYIHAVGGMFFDTYRPGRQVSPSATVGLKIAYQLP